MTKKVWCPKKDDAQVLGLENYMNATFIFFKKKKKKEGNKGVSLGEKDKFNLVSDGCNFRMESSNKPTDKCV